MQRLGWAGWLSVVILALVNCMTALAVIAPARADDGGVTPDRDYRLGSGDTVSITVYGEPDLSVVAKVGSNGRVAYPFLGELTVTGVTLAELEKRLTKALDGEYLRNPKVSVTVTEYRQYFINGQVHSPGGHPYQPGLTVRKAITLAGGLTERASERKITLIPDGSKDKQGRKVGMDDPVSPGDIITIDESFF
jgi:polysaccharide export outer membrane protein